VAHPRRRQLAQTRRKPRSLLLLLWCSNRQTTNPTATTKKLALAQEPLV
jgi:hypothetical protein